MAQSLQNLVYEIGYAVNDSGLEKSTQLIGTLESSLSNFIKNVDSATSALNKLSEPIGTLSKSTSDLNVNNLSDSLKKSQENSDGLNSSTERLERLTKLVNDYADEYNSKIDKSSQLAQEWNNRTTPLSKTLSEINAEQQKLNDEIFKTNSEEEQTAVTMNKVVDGIKKSVTGVGELNSSMRSTHSLARGISSILGAFGFIGIGYETVRGIQTATSAFIDFQQEMARVHATLGEISNNDLAGLSKQAIDISNKWGVSSEEIGVGMENLASHGFNLKQVMASIEPATLLAVAGNIKMEDATLDVSSAIRNFNLDVSKASHVTDVYAKAAMDTAAAMPDMATAMSYIAPVAQQAGWTIENTAAAIGILSNAGIKGSKAGTGLREMYSRLIKPTKDAASLMKELGFSAIDPTTHKMKDIGTIVGDLNKALSGLNSAQRSAALSYIFGQQALTPMTALLNSNKDAIDAETKSLENSDGAGKKYADTVNDTVRGSLNKLEEKIKNVFITDIDKTNLGKTMRKFLDDMNDKVPELANNLDWFLTTAMKVGSGISRNWGGISSIILGVASAFLTLKGAMAIEGAIKSLGGLKKALPTIKSAAGIGLIATGFSEIHQGNEGLGDMLVATGVGFTVASNGVKKLTSVGIGLVAQGFLEIHQGNEGLGALLIATGAGFVAVNNGLKMAGVIGALGAAFIAIKEGNTGLGALLIGTAVGLALIEVVTAPVALAIGLVAAGIAYLIIQCATVKEVWNKTWLAIKGAAIDIINPIIDLINGLTSALNKIPGVAIGKIGKIGYNSNDKAMMKSLGMSDAQIAKETGQTNFKVTTSTQSLVNSVVGGSKDITKYLPKTKYAGGTNNSIGGSALVGEKGPEIVNLPAGSQVIPNNEMNKVLRASRITMNNYVNQHTLYGQDAVRNFSTALLNREPLATTATTKVSQDNKNIMNNLSLSGNTYGSGMINNMTQGVKDSGSNLTTTVQTLTDKVVETFRSGFGIHSPSTVMYGMGTNLMQGLVNGMTSKDMNAFVQDWIGSITSSAGGAVNGNLVGWLSAAMAITGTPMSYLPLLENIAMHESGGNPLAINLWDSNAMAGHPSKGLMQMIDSSFSRYAISGLGDIYNPIANAAASIRYMLGTYGSISNVPGITSQLRGGGYVGYEQGTENASPGPAIVGEKGPELLWMNGGEKVTPTNEIDDEINKVRIPYNAVVNNSQNQISPSINIAINGAENPRATAQEVYKVVKRRFGDLFDEKMSTLKIQMGLGDD